MLSPVGGNIEFSRCTVIEIFNWRYGVSKDCLRLEYARSRVICSCSVCIVD